ncbi:uncharacterized protein VP01_1316g4 [Puccinia sorghi]|uniref:Uncharacterized protein n=1 Tax=Puccinia sorghi TaxID=27349 RepID=A0A0L6VNC0_9BASI|nr:uncharacterized protein VP01_1316g4 [Puccinia sorghi]
MVLPEVVAFFIQLGQVQRSRHRNCDNSDKTNLSVFEDTVNLHMEKIYSKNPSNLKYDWDFPVYIDPQNPNLYFPLTVGKNTGANGVSVFSPPLLIKFLLSSKKRKTTQLFGSKEVHVQLLGTLLRNKAEGGSPAQADGNQSSTVPLETDVMGNYLDFIKIRPDKQDTVLEILDQKDISSYRLFQSKSINQRKMSRWGLSDGIIAQLQV